MNGTPVSSEWAMRLIASGSVSVTGFSPSTGIPACSAFTVTGWCATGTVGSTSRSARSSSAGSTPSVPTAIAEGSSAPDCSMTFWGAPSTRSATPTSSATSLATISRAHHEPIPPAPTTTTFAGRSPGRRGKPVGRGLGWVSRVASDDTRDLGAAVPVAGGVGDLHRCRLAVLGTGPGRGVGEHALDLRLVVDGVLLVAGAEVEHLALAPTEHGAGAEHLA